MHISDISSEIIFFQINLENCNKTLLDLQESYRLAITMLKEKEFIISKLQRSGKSTERSAQFWASCCTFPLTNFYLFIYAKTENSLIECAKELRTNLQSASEDIASLFVKLGKRSFLFPLMFCRLSILLF